MIEDPEELNTKKSTARSMCVCALIFSTVGGHEINTAPFSPIPVVVAPVVVEGLRVATVDVSEVTPVVGRARVETVGAVVVAATVLEVVPAVAIVERAVAAVVATVTRVATTEVVTDEVDVVVEVKVVVEVDVAVEGKVVVTVTVGILRKVTVESGERAFVDANSDWVTMVTLL